MQPGVLFFMFNHNLRFVIVYGLDNKWLLVCVTRALLHLGRLKQLVEEPRDKDRQEDEEEREKEEKDEDEGHYSSSSSERLVCVREKSSSWSFCRNSNIFIPKV